MEDRDAQALQEARTQARIQTEEGEEEMSAMTRNPTGHGENATVLGIFASLGLWLGGLVDDPNLSNAIVIGTTIAGKSAQTFVSNWLGGPVAAKLGLSAMKGAQLGAILLALWMPLGCAMAITGDGAFLNVGQSTVSTCGDVAGDAPEGSPQAQDCTVVDGGPISQQAGSMIGGVLSGALRMLGLSYGVPGGSSE